MSNPIKSLTKKEWVLWIVSLLIVTASNLVTGQVEPLTLAAADIGITAFLLQRATCGRRF